MFIEKSEMIFVEYDDSWFNAFLNVAVTFFCIWLIAAIFYLGFMVGENKGRDLERLRITQADMRLK